MRAGGNVRMLRLEGKRVLVTGASSGIGWHLADLIAKRGGQLVLAARRVDRLHQLRSQIEREGHQRPLVVRCDVSRAVEVDELRMEVERQCGGIDVLVNNAGRGSFGPFEAASRDDFESVVNTNLLGVIYCTQAFLPEMLERRRGHIVFVSSVLGQLPAPDHAVYGATKFAVSGLAESLDYELSDRGITITLVEPGLIQSEFAAVSGMPPERFEQIPWKSSEEVAGLIVTAIEREKRRCVPDRLAKLGIDLRRHFPTLMRIVFARALRRVRKATMKSERTEVGL